MWTADACDVETLLITLPSPTRSTQSFQSETGHYRRRVFPDHPLAALGTDFLRCRMLAFRPIRGHGTIRSCRFGVCSGRSLAFAAVDNVPTSFLVRFDRPARLQGVQQRSRTEDFVARSYLHDSLAPVLLISSYRLVAPLCPRAGVKPENRLTVQRATT